MARTSSLTVLAELSDEVPAALAEHAQAWEENPEAVEPRPAASVLLVRDRSDGAEIEAYLLHRHARMPFAPNMVVFPGGRVDPVDLGRVDPVDADPHLSRDAVLRACAVRETEEETGVVLSSANLINWAHWITPEFEPRRYDTWFYLAALPAGQVAADVSGETDRAEWQSPAKALQDGDRGLIGLMPPTRSLLLELSRFSSVAALLSAGVDRQVETVLPQLLFLDGRWRFRYPSPEEPRR